MKDNRLITDASRVESMGGLVTCAKHCLKYSNSNRGRLESGATGVSVPMDPRGSSPFSTIGFNMNLMSSFV